MRMSRYTIYVYVDIYVIYIHPGPPKPKESLPTIYLLILPSLSLLVGLIFIVIKYHLSIPNLIEKIKEGK